MRSFIQTGDVLAVIAPRAVAADVGVLVGASLFGISCHSAANGAPLEIKTCGVFGPVAKATGQAWAVGTLIYWDNTNFNFTTTSSGNRLVGVAGAAAISGAAVGTVILDGATR
jgi:predicted RecA/RadA family phage recombinase